MRPGFDNLLRVEETEDGKHATVLDPLGYLSEIPGVPMIYVPVGFTFDYASHPFRTARGQYNRAACVHDWLYATAPDWCTRKIADRIFFEAMIQSGVSWFRAKSFYLGVRSGGWIPWRRHRKNDSDYVIGDLNPS